MESVRDMHNSENNDMHKASTKMRFQVQFNLTTSTKQDFTNALMINTVADGQNSGRTYYLQASSSEDYHKLSRSLKKNSKRERERVAAQTRFAKLQLRTRKIFSSQWFQGGSATLIIAVRRTLNLRIAHIHSAAEPLPPQNFLVSIFEAQYGSKMTLGNGSTTELGQMTDNLNLAFTVVFIFELLINILGHWPRAFISNSWVLTAPLKLNRLQHTPHSCLESLSPSQFSQLILSLAPLPELARRLHRGHVRPRPRLQRRPIVAGPPHATNHPCSAHRTGGNPHRISGTVTHQNSMPPF